MGRNEENEGVILDNVVLKIYSLPAWRGSRLNCDVLVRQNLQAKSVRNSFTFSIRSNVFPGVVRVGGEENSPFQLMCIF